MKAHPYADIFPMVPEADLNALAEDIKVHGQMERVVTFDGMVLDGRNRLAACKLAGVTPEFEAFIGNRDEALAYVMSKNLHRRHLDTSQRAMVAARLANVRVGRANGSNSANLPGGISQPAAAEMLNVSPRSVGTAKEVLDHGAAALVKAVESGAVSVSAGATLSELPKDAQKAVVEQGPEAVKAKAKEIREKASPKAKAEPLDADFQWSDLDKAYGPLVRFADRAAKGTGTVNGLAHRGVMRLLDQLAEAFKQWKQETKHKGK